MSSNLRFANADTPSPGADWAGLSDNERLLRVKDAMATEPLMNELLVVISARQDGQIIVNLREPLSADRRGTVLLDFEAFLKDALDEGLAVWLEGLGDKNSLRNLRGIEVKT